MAKIIWNDTGARLYETGVRQGVLYPKSVQGLYPLGVAWNGLTAVTETPTGAEPTPLWADDAKYLTLMSAEEFGGTIEAYTYPDEFAQCDGSAEIQLGVLAGQQTRQAFGLCYRTVLGNDVSGNEFGYKLHIIYNAVASPSEKAYATINDAPEAITFSWEITTTPVPVNNHRPTSTIIIDSTKANAARLLALENILYGTATLDPRLPLPNEIITLMAPVP